MVEKISYRGWNNAWQLSNGTVELVVLADVGPRIVRYGFCRDENILCELSQEAGLTGGNDFRLYGGHRLWAWPEVARTYFPDNRPVSVSQAGETIRFTSPIEDSSPGTHLQKQFEITLDQQGTPSQAHGKVATAQATAGPPVRHDPAGWNQRLHGCLWSMGSAVLWSRESP